jgi:Tfp pilus assembly protein PilF
MSLNGKVIGMALFKRSKKRSQIPDGYFEVERPDGDGVCSDDQCPCGYPGEKIARGAGFLFITPDVVEFHNDARSVIEAQKKVHNMNVSKQQGNFSADTLTGPILINPILLCSRGALNRGLDLGVAAADAKHWWQTGLAPLRPTPVVHAGGDTTTQPKQDDTPSGAPTSTPTVQKNEALLWINKGLSFFKSNNHEAALQCFDKALEVDPNDSRAWTLKADALQELGRNHEALGYYNKALKLDPQNTEAWRAKGITASRLNRPEEALQCYDTALTVDPKDSRAWGLKGRELYELGRYQEALQCYDTALALNHHASWMILELKKQAVTALGKTTSAK